MQDAVPLAQSTLPDEMHGASIELGEYLKDAFGNATRIDYGTGHESNFVAFLCCLYVLGAVGNEDLGVLVARVFPRYDQICTWLCYEYMW